MNERSTLDTNVFNNTDHITTKSKASNRTYVCRLALSCVSRGDCIFLLNKNTLPNSTLLRINQSLERTLRTHVHSLNLYTQKWGPRRAYYKMEYRSIHMECDGLLVTLSIRLQCDILVLPSFLIGTSVVVHSLLIICQTLNLWQYLWRTIPYLCSWIFNYDALYRGQAMPLYCLCLVHQHQAHLIFGGLQRICSMSRIFWRDDWRKWWELAVARHAYTTAPCNNERNWWEIGDA